ncbi:L-xylulose reductase-like [Panonychus citri]|uniref:L-xylulose reductase-like n=1 Tax=Panonychus citri TaxID=50023 RepID=UPI0023074D9B|nr:L-xylulose reductase-like [Panonychus citri]
MNVNLKGKNVLVTGASRGIGLRLVERFVEAEAAKVYAVCIDGEALEKLKESLPSVETLIVDLSKWEETRERLSSLDIVHCLVNCAGVVEYTETGQITEAQWDFHFDVNTKAILNVSQIICNKLIAAGEKGSVVNISSIASHRFTPNHLVYSASKAAVDNITCTMAVDYGRKGIRVNSINPTVVSTPMGAKMWSDPAKSGPLLERTPTGRFNTTDDIADLILFLLSERAAMLNGVVLPIDGGYSRC